MYIFKCHTYIKMKKEENEEIILCKCFICKKNYLANLMKDIKIKEPLEESYITVKRFICLDCHKDLKEFKWIKETEDIDKKEKNE